MEAAKTLSSEVWQHLGTASLACPVSAAVGGAATDPNPEKRTPFLPALFLVSCCCPSCCCCCCCCCCRCCNRCCALLPSECLLQGRDRDGSWYLTANCRGRQHLIWPRSKQLSALTRMLAHAQIAALSLVMKAHTRAKEGRARQGPAPSRDLGTWEFSAHKGMTKACYCTAPVPHGSPPL